MAQKGRFVEEVNTQSSSFTSASRGQISDKSLGSLFSGAGSVVGSAIKVADNQFQESIQNKVDDFYESETGDQDPAIMDFASEGVPSEITNGTENILKMSKAYGNGLISDSQFFMRASSLAKRLKSQYPGHKEYVDAAIGKARGTSANMARRSLLSELGKLSSSAQKGEEAKQKEFNKLVGEGYVTFDRVNQIGMDAAIQEALTLKGRSEATKRDIDLISAQLKAGNLTEEQSVDQYIQKIPELTAAPVNRALAAALGYTGNLGNRQEFVQFMNSVDFSALTGEQVQQIQLHGNQLLSQMRTAVIQDPGFQSMTAKGQKAILDTVDGQLGPMAQFLKNSDWKGLTAYTEAMNAGTQQEVSRLTDHLGLQEFQIQQQIIKDNFPEGSEQRAVFDRLLSQKWEGQGMKVVTEGTVALVLNGELEVPDLMTKLQSTKDMKPEDKVRLLHTVLETSKQVFKTRDPNDPRFRDTALAMFRQAPDELMRHWTSQEARLQVFNSMIDPSFSEKIMRSTPEVQTGFRNFIAGSFGSVTTSQFGDMNRAASDYLSNKFLGEPDSRNFRIEVDPEAGRFKASHLGRELQPRERQALESMTKINSMLDKIIPVLTAGGKSNPEALTELLQRSNHNFDQDPWMKTLMETMGSWWDNNSQGQIPSEDEG